MAYSAPVKDIRFALEAAADLWSLKQGGAFADLDSDLLGAILEQAGALASETLSPLNASGDRAGISLKDDVVTSAPGFKEAYAQYVEAGWQALAADPAYGGQGLPHAVAIAVSEMVHGANMAFGLCPLLTMGAAEAVAHHGTDEQRERYLAKLNTGEWTGTMNLTEPQAGSDVGALTTKAEPDGDAFRITGQKIFITWGEHDMADNIVHLVLARLPGAPNGTKGVTLFLVPKILPDGSRNSVRCIGVEHKLGVHASPTCTMSFEGAKGWLLGGENQGMACMFTMMNSARLSVGTESIAVAEAAYQKALAYAHERKQGRAEGETQPGSSPIVRHADVRRTLMGMKAKIMAGRAICYATAVAADLARQGDKAAKAREDLLTPIAKGWSSERAIEVCSSGVQVHGGMGFVEEGGAAQFYRDVRITTIYEGTTGVQGMDLIGRKIIANRGEAMSALIADMREIVGQCRRSNRQFMEHIAARLEEGLRALDNATQWLLAVKDRRDALAGASPYLQLAGDVLGGALIAKGVLAAHAANAHEAASHEAMAAFYAETILAAAPGLVPSVTMGAALLFDPGLEELAG